MKQLKMCWQVSENVVTLDLPSGYSLENYKGEEDKKLWCDCCSDGRLIDESIGTEAFDNAITSITRIDPYSDVFFLKYQGKAAGTITAFVRDDGAGNVHMVGICPEFRGKGLAKYLLAAAKRKLQSDGVKYAFLTTDEFRRSAIKSYLSADFLPVDYDIGMQDRWEAVLEDLNVDSVQMLYEDLTPYQVIYRKSKCKKVRIGVFGAGRGQSMMDYCRASNNSELVAVCDAWQWQLDRARRKFGESVTYYTDFDEFIKHDMDAVVIANYANEHAPYAIRCLKAGKNVLSEVLPVQTMKEAVELVEAVEESGKIYAYAENNCFMPAPREMRALYREGVLGSFEYGEGEYIHNCEPDWFFLTIGNPDHWRNTMSAFYYCTHSIGPLVHISGERPVKVSGFEVPFNKRMERMGAKAGPMAVEMITLESGAVLKSFHGVGPSRNSIWYSIYGSKGRIESIREEGDCFDIKKMFINCDENEGDNNIKTVEVTVEGAMDDVADKFGHGGADFYLMYQFVQKLRGNKNADVIDVYEAMDMFLPGMFAYFSVLDGGSSMDVPNLRNKEERDKWRNDTRCTDPKVAGDQLIPSYSKGNPHIAPEIYEGLRLKMMEEEKKITAREIAEAEGKKEQE
ncbi:MAG: GNAT family N-acetyltransferase [Clostridiales bacterium]|nr:GNAT family N-acetyltransferase [Clostridiales bacterium]